MEIMDNKNRIRALKAWETIRNRGHKTKLNTKKHYNLTAKNKVRNEILKIIKEFNYAIDNDDKNYKKSILTLDTHEYLLSKELKNWDIFLSENNKKEFLAMNETKPNNVFLHLGNVIELSKLIKEFDVIYLDFCNSYETEKNNILELKYKIARCKLVGFTFCLRRNSKKLEDYKFDLINKIQHLLYGLNLKLIYGSSYRDGAPMCTLLFENKNNGSYKDNILDELNLFGEQMCTDAIEIIKNKHPYIFSPHQIFDAYANTILVKWNDDLLLDVFFEMLNKDKIPFPYFNYESKLIYKDFPLKGLYNFFENCLFKHIWTLWKHPKQKYIESYYILWWVRWQKYFITDTNNKINCINDCDEAIFIFKNKPLCETCFKKLREEVLKYDLENMQKPEQKEIKSEFEYRGYKFMCSVQKK